MPTVECVRTDCQHHGIEICIARRIKFDGKQCSDYKPRIGRQMMDQPFKANCHKSGGKYKSDHIRLHK